MTQISEQAMCMSRFDRRNQLVCWYADGINLCTHVRGIAGKIKVECKRRNLKYVYARARDNIYKIHIGKSLKALIRNYRNYMLMVVCLH